jgi:L-ascorbate metabolism protein UlaG (beta-lactamase superfamily)
MRVHVIGHASLLIEADGVTILMDPVFWDPHYEGTAVTSPGREVRPEHLPAYDVIAVSHRHFDHFDVRTLASLDKRCPVLIPDGDVLLRDAMLRLGFSRCQPLRDGQRVTVGRTAITTTPSRARVREFGLLVRDSSATVWNPVDTHIDKGTAVGVADAHGPIDLLLATWQPLLEAEVLTNGPTSFPHAAYFRMLSTVRLVHPRAAMPSACGFKYTGPGVWLNRFVFPVSRDMFLRDVAALAPDTRLLAPNPGDIVDVHGPDATLEVAASPFVRTVRDDPAETAFDPTSCVPELSDQNPHAYGEEQMSRTIRGFLDDGLRCALERSRQRGRLARQYQRLGIVYQLDVVFPSHTRSWSIDFSRDLSLTEAATPGAGIRSRIAASLLADLILGRCSVGYVFGVGGYRFWQRVYTLGPTGAYRWKPASQPSVVDPLWMALDAEALFKQSVDRDIARYHGPHQPEPSLGSDTTRHHQRDRLGGDEDLA